MNSVPSTAILLFIMALGTAHAGEERELSASQIQLIKEKRPDLSLAFVIGRPDLNSDGVEDLVVQALYPEGEGIAVLTTTKDQNFKVVGISRSWPTVNRLMYRIWAKGSSVYVSTGECIYSDCTKTTYEFHIRKESVILAGETSEKSKVNGKVLGRKTISYAPNKRNASGGKPMSLEEFSLE